MGISLIPNDVRQRYHVEERRHACAILRYDCHPEFDDLVGCLREFELLRSEVTAAGGRKSQIADRFDDYLTARGWEEKKTDVRMTVDGEDRSFETHKVDLCRNRVAIEVEWNNKDPFYSRDLNTFRLLHEIGIISVGIIITRCDKLQEIFDGLGYVTDKNGRLQNVGKKYGASTTHWCKLMPRVEAGGGGGCPLLLVGIGRSCYKDDIPHAPIRSTA